MARDPQAIGPIIRGFAGTHFRLDGSTHAALLLTPEQAIDWKPPPIEALDEAALAPLLGIAPPIEFLLLGTGAVTRLPTPALRAALEARGIGIEAMDSRAAARAWAVLRGEERWIGGAFYPL